MSISIAQVVSLLEQGKPVAQTRWNGEAMIFVQDGTIVCQNGDNIPYNYPFDWNDLTKHEWQAVSTT